VHYPNNLEQELTGHSFQEFKEVDMSSNNDITNIRSGMRVFSADGISIGKVWQVHLRDTEAVIEVRPQSFLRTILDVFALHEMQPNSDHLFLPGQIITRVVTGKQVQVGLDAVAARACVSRPPWVELDRKGWNSNGLD
jgi:hypothetical protein